MWQNCEQLKLGYATHFSMTNNVAESFGSQLLVNDFNSICIHDMTAGGSWSHDMSYFLSVCETVLQVQGPESAGCQ
jgi:hypothetical protein